ncbi:AzlC family ABC transporter permease [Haloarculaceae archaeon H-GB2-1]|nr:AzlC family ABC transporter permease [Haloarculaceae archaeon H-GB1-1]MEA5388676.1 AzlC family ABC transporter permease [Haloarculaceae archaeon H-GB11]MEA5406732.1 AzlC family ABC transporter permease [Haloarculaceae archaeon H-GB2-1]
MHAEEHRESAGERSVESDRGDGDLSFTLAGVRAGYVACLPVALGVGGYGLVFGVLADRAGLSAAEAVLTSATVLAGAAQLVAMELWTDPIPVATVVLTVAVVNLRYVLMGAALRPWFRHLSPLAAYGSVFFTADENWALTMGRLRDGSTNGAFLLGSGLAIWSFWVAATAVGALAGGLITDPARFGLDFVLVAVFVAIAVGLYEGRETLAPWALAFVVAVAGAHLLPGKWYILLGGVAGSLLEVARFDG